MLLERRALSRAPVVLSRCIAGARRPMCFRPPASSFRPRPPGKSLGLVCKFPRGKLGRCVSPSSAWASQKSSIPRRWPAGLASSSRHPYTRDGGAVPIHGCRTNPHRVAHRSAIRGEPLRIMKSVRFRSSLEYRQHLRYCRQRCYILLILRCVFDVW